MTRKVTKLLTMALTLLVVAALALSLSACGGKTAEGNEKEISIMVEIVDDKGEKTTLDIDTSETYLADALVEEGIIEYDENGLYTTVNGITADYNKDGAWWCVTKKGAMTTEGMNTLKLADGDKYEITYTK